MEGQLSRILASLISASAVDNRASNTGEGCSSAIAILFPCSFIFTVQGYGLPQFSQKGGTGTMYTDDPSAKCWWTGILVMHLRQAISVGAPQSGHRFFWVSGCDRAKLVIWWPFSHTCMVSNQVAGPASPRRKMLGMLSHGITEKPHLNSRNQPHQYTLVQKRGKDEQNEAEDRQGFARGDLVQQNGSKMMSVHFSSPKKN